MSKLPADLTMRAEIDVSVRIGVDLLQDMLIHHGKLSSQSVRFI
jgi:hypothetical protein